MSVSARSQYGMAIAVFLGAALLFVVEVPFIVTVLFTTLCMAWSGWVFLSIFRGGDELQSASLRYSLAAASGVGVPVSIALVMLMVALPELQGAVTDIAAFSKSGLSPAAVGFALGIVFVVLVQSVVCAIGNWMWWASKR